MIARALGVAAAVVLAAAVHADDEANKKQLARFAGVWKVDSLAVNGNELPSANIAILTVQFKDGNIVIENMVNNESQVTKLPITIDPGFDPGLFDVKVDSDKRTLEGIYKFDGDRLKICVNANGQSRPTEITAAEGTIVLVLSPKK